MHNVVKFYHVTICLQTTQSNTSKLPYHEKPVTANVMRAIVAMMDQLDDVRETVVRVAREANGMTKGLKAIARVSKEANVMDKGYTKPALLY